MFFCNSNHILDLKGGISIGSNWNLSCCNKVPIISVPEIHRIESFLFQNIRMHAKLRS